MLTIFTIPKSFKDPHISLIQRNAIGSWLALPIEKEVILIGDDEGVAEVAKEFCVKHFPLIERNEYGTPLVNSIFSIAQLQAKYDILIYINADIILMSGLAEVFTHLPEDRFLLIGRRWDLEVSKLVDFSLNNWENHIRESVADLGILRNECCIDYFYFRKGLWKSIPPFAIGRFRHDRWLVNNAIITGAKVIDATEVIIAVHQNHDYRHLPGGGYESKQAAEEVRINGELYPEKDVTDTIWDAKYILTADGIKKRKFTREHFDWRLRRRIFNKYPFLGKVVNGLIYPEKLWGKIFKNS